jgi:ABC-type sugar transport system ATPase subunit
VEAVAAHGGPGGAGEPAPRPDRGSGEGGEHPTLIDRARSEGAALTAEPDAAGGRAGADELEIAISLPLDRFALEVEVATRARVTAVFGPSGAGKSSLLESVVGMRRASGRIRFGDAVWLDSARRVRLPPERRRIGYVPQEGLLFPHRTVRGNLLAGAARARRAGAGGGATPPAARLETVCELLELTPLLERRVGTLSGGERQRVALGRALVRRPKIFLFDEPLSSLDAQLRQELREELARLHRITRTTSIYVTHDQKEALSLGDKVAVMQVGKLRQLATPEDVYRNPHDLFVARFVGEPPINLIRGEVAGGDGTATFRAPGFRMALNGRPRASGPATLGLRAESIAISTQAAAGQEQLHATVDRVEHLGGETLVHLRGEWGGLVVRAPGTGAVPTAGSRVAFVPDPARALLFDPSGTRI